MKRISLFLILVLCVSACTTAQPAQTSAAQSPTEQPPTEPPPTQTPAPTEIPDEEPPMFTITFDGSGCTADAPETLALGKYSFLVKNSTDSDLVLWVFLLPADTTFQDLLDKQGEPGRFFPASYDYRPPTKIAQRWDDTLGGNFYTYSFIEAGEYVAALGGLNNDSLWFCPPINIAAE